MSVIQEMFSNKILVVTLLAWLCAQVSKTIINAVTTHSFNPERLVGAGGMPSAHSASVCALTVITARVEGIGSPFFAFAFVLASIVMYDAMGVRRAAGEQAKVLNKVVFNFKDLFDVSLNPADDNDSDEDGDGQKELKEFLGHTPMQVLAGALLGILIALLAAV